MFTVKFHGCTTARRIDRLHVLTWRCPGPRTLEQVGPPVGLDLHPANPAQVEELGRGGPVETWMRIKQDYSWRWHLLLHYVHLLCVLPVCQNGAQMHRKQDSVVDASVGDHERSGYGVPPPRPCCRCGTECSSHASGGPTMWLQSQLAPILLAAMWTLFQLSGHSNWNQPFSKEKAPQPNEPEASEVTVLDGLLHRKKERPFQSGRKTFHQIISSLAPAL